MWIFDSGRWSDLTSMLFNGVPQNHQFDTGILQCPDQCLKGWAFVWRMLGFEEMLAKWTIGWHCQGLERGCPCRVGTKETSVKTLVPKFRSDGIFGNWWSATFYHVIVSNRLHGTAFGRVNCNWKTEEVGIGPYPDVADAWGREYFLNYRMEEKGWKQRQRPLNGYRYAYGCLGDSWHEIPGRIWRCMLRTGQLVCRFFECKAYFSCYHFGWSLVPQRQYKVKFYGVPVGTS